TAEWPGLERSDAIGRNETTTYQEPGVNQNPGWIATMILAVLMSACQKDTASTEATEAKTAEAVAAASAAPEYASGVQLDALDRDTRPQDDFYQCANGGWLDRSEIPDIYSGYTVYHQVYEDAEQALKIIIEEAAANPGAAGSESQQIGD